MTIPNLPTDNLYKFIALTGVLLFAISIVYPEYQRAMIRDEITVYNGEVTKIDLEREKTKRKLKDIKEQVKELDNKTGCKCNSIVNDTIITRTRIIEGPKELVNLSLQLDRLVEDYITINRELNIKGAEVAIKLELINNKKEDLNNLNEATSIFGPLSFLLALGGFLFWYDNTQKYQDKVLKEQANQFLKTDRCQSCGMRLSNQKHYHLFTIEDKQSIYCKTCFGNGEFIDPDITLEQMKQKVKKRCKQLGFGKIVTYAATRSLEDLERWRKKFKWE